MKKIVTICALMLVAAVFMPPPIYSRAVSGTDEPSVWAAADVAKANDFGLIPDGMYRLFRRNISREDFCKLAMALYVKVTGRSLRHVSDNPFTDTDDISTLNAYSLGIVNGVGAKLFAPRTAITRQEIAVMLRNTINVIDETNGAEHGILADSTTPLTFSDKPLIADWAGGAIEILRGNNIMLGTDSNRFDPLGNTTREMAFILMNRVYLIYSGLDATQSFPPAYTGEILLKHKGGFSTDGALSLIGDVHEMYPDVSLTQIESFLDGEAFNPETEAGSYYIDISESLSESVSQGHTNITAENYYPVYVFIHEDDPSSRLYMKLYFGVYQVFRDAELTEPLTITTFSDVVFNISDDTRVLISDAAYTYEGLQNDAPELLDTYLWRVRLFRGAINRLVAVIAGEGEEP